MDNIRFVEAFYGSGAHQPLSYSRTKELAGVQAYAKAYGLEVTEIEFDTAIANRFGDGCEYEWLRD